MALRLNAGSDDGQGGGVFARQMSNRNGRHCGRPRFGDVAAIHNRLQCARIGIEQQNRRQMRRKLARCIAGEHGHELGAQARWMRDECRHQAEIGTRRADHEHRANRLEHFAGGKSAKRRLHRCNQVAHGKERLDLLFGQ
jgi:hypothetical protein